MPPDFRKIIGSFVLVIFVVVYALLVMKLAAATLPSMGAWGQLAFYTVFGLLWVLPAGVIIWWSLRPKT